MTTEDYRRAFPIVESIILPAGLAVTSTLLDHEKLARPAFKRFIKNVVLLIGPQPSAL